MRLKIQLFFPLLFLLFWLLPHSRMSAQFDAQISHYMLLPGTYNPASAGENEDMQFSVINRQQWVGIEDAPSTLFLNLSMPFNVGRGQHGFGLSVMKESIGLFNTQTLQLQYAWKKKLGPGRLSVGIQGGILQEGFNASGIYIPSSDFHSSSDVSVPTGDLEGTIGDLSAGVWYQLPKVYAGFSASHLLENKIKLKEGENTGDEDDEGTTMIASRTFYLTNGYNILFSNPLYTLQPSFLLKTDLTAWQADLSARLIYKDRFWGGLSWRMQDAVVVLAGIKLAQGLSIGYSYDISTSAVARFAAGSHELFMSYSRKINTAGVSKKQKSVRIL